MENKVLVETRSEGFHHLVFYWVGYKIARRNQKNGNFSTMSNTNVASEFIQFEI